MRARINLALYPARARRRAAGLLVSSAALAAALTVAHLVWASVPARSAAEIQGEAELLRREAALQQARVQELRLALDPAAVQELADRVEIANELIRRAAVDPVALLALLEAQAPRGLLVERLLLSGAPEGLRAELTLRALSQDDALELIRRLRTNDAIRELTPVREQVDAAGGQVVLSLLYRPERIDPGGAQ